MRTAEIIIKVREGHHEIARMISYEEFLGAEFDIAGDAIHEMLQQLWLRARPQLVPWPRKKLLTYLWCRGREAGGKILERGEESKK